MPRRIIICIALVLCASGCHHSKTRTAPNKPTLIPKGAPAPERPKATIAQECPWYIVTAPTSPKAVCKAVAKLAKWETESTCDEDIDPIITMPKQATRAMRFVVHRSYPKETTYLAIEHRRRWFVVELQTEHDVGMAGISESVTFPQMRFVQYIKGGLPELVIEHHKEKNDSDMNINEYEYDYEHHLLVVDFQRPQPTIALDIQTYKASGRDFLVQDEEDKSIKHSPNVPRKKETGVKVMFAPETNQYIISARDKIKPNHKLGTFDLKAPNTQCALPTSVN